MTAIIWFRQDLRCADNPALHRALQHQQILPIYILDDDSTPPMGAASRIWLHHSLSALNTNLNRTLSLYSGNPLEVITKLIQRFNITAVYWNRCYEPWRIACDSKIKVYLKSKGVDAISSNASLLWEPWTVHKNDGTPYKVFTPFYRKGCLAAPEPERPITQTPQRHQLLNDHQSQTLDSLNLLPPWHHNIESHWLIGEKGAQQTLEAFLTHGLKHYRMGRDYPSAPYVSRLSPYLHFGELSVHMLWHRIKALPNHHDSDAIDLLQSQLGWREFSYYLLYHQPQLPQDNLQTKFNTFPWRSSPPLLRAWQQGNTGFPIVDAGMRELWHSGYMHNRVRMIVGSFLVKNLLQHWHHGAQWFWDTLVDADLANNSASWQWIAGCGADAAPYFRIFNPVLQGQKHDPEGHYVRRFIPELAALPNKYLFSPWLAPQEVLNQAKVTLGKTYPLPIVDLKTSREQALAAYQTLKTTLS